MESGTLAKFTRTKLRVLTLKGNANELGSYECRWNNSRGEARQRQFTVSVTFAEEISDNYTIFASVTATVLGLLAVGIGISIKFYLDKVRNKMQI
jgi:hypothetical protein